MTGTGLVRMAQLALTRVFALPLALFRFGAVTRGSRTVIQLRSHALVFAVALSPVFLTIYTCDRGDTYIATLELEVAGQNQISGFDINNRSYAVTLNSSTAILRVKTRMITSTASYQWIVGGTTIEAGDIPPDDPNDPVDWTGTVPINVPVGQSVLRLNVRSMEGTVDGYTVDVTRLGKAKTLTLACRDTVFTTNDITFLDVELTVAPTAITPGDPFTADVNAVVPFPESILDVAQILPGGVKRATFDDARVEVVVRSGAVGTPVVLTLPPSSATTCALHESAPGVPAICDKANDNPDNSNTDCLYFGMPAVSDPCAVFVDAQIEEDCAVCDVMPGSGFGVPKSTQCANNGFCIAGPFLLPLQGQSWVYTATAGAGGEVLFGLADDSTQAVLNPDDTWTLAPADNFYINGLRAGVADEVWGFVPITMECTMGIDTGTGPGSDPLTQEASRTPDADLISFDIVDLCTGVTCADDGNECTSDLCSPIDGSCPYTPLSDGTSCSFGGNPSAGVCVSGVCEDACTQVNCDDGKSCTVDSCANGVCDNSLAASNGTPCGDGLGECFMGSCQPAFPAPQTKTITLGCSNNITTNETVILDVELTVTPSPIISGQPFTADISGSAVFSEELLDRAQMPLGGLSRAEMQDVSAMVLLRSGGTGLPLWLGLEPIAFTCGTTVDGFGDPVVCTPFDDPSPCTDLGDTCGQFVDAPVDTDCGACALLDTLPATTKADQCMAHGFCITGGWTLPLGVATAAFTADAVGEVVLVGLDDQNTGAIVLPDGTYQLPASSANPADPDYPYTNGLRAVVAGVVAVVMECTMAVDSNGPDGVGVPDRASPTPDSALFSFPIFTPCADANACDSTPVDCLDPASCSADGVCQARQLSPDGTACSLGVCMAGVCEFIE